MSFDPHSNEWLLNRFEIYNDLRTRDTAYWSDKYNLYVITRYDDVLFALSNPNIFSSARGNLLIENEVRFGKTLGASDNPIHNKYKTSVMNAYNKENTKRIAEVFSTKAKEYFSNEEINISDITEELSAWTVCELLNFPIDKELFKNIILDLHRYYPNIHMFDPNEKIKDVSSDMDIIFDTVSKKIPATGPGFYQEYMNNNPHSVFLILANILSGTGSLVGALQYLTLDLYYEDQLEKIMLDRSLIPAAINESLRFRASTGRFYRTVKENVTIHNLNLKPGDRVALCLESANRDPDKFANPDQFIITRDSSKHLSWGHGVHACLAIGLSKEMLNIYLNTLLDQIGKYEILTKPKELQYVFIKGGNIDIMSNIMLRKL